MKTQILKAVVVCMNKVPVLTIIGDKELAEEYVKKETSIGSNVEYINMNVVFYNGSSND